MIVDAYVSGRYGSFLPYHLVTKEFFELAKERLNDQGIIAYNVIGTMHGWRADILGAVYQTLKSIFPQVYFFPASDSLNVVLIASKNPQRVTLPVLKQKAGDFIRQGRVTMPSFGTRVLSFQSAPPRSATHSPVLTDNFAPVDGLLTKTSR
jgi:hypothetical protein